MIRIHNFALLRVLSAIVGFSIMYNILALYDDFQGMEYISLTVLPILFIISINMLNKRSPFWLLVPLTLYLIDRFVVYLSHGITNIRDGALIFDELPIASLFLQVNGVRFILAFIVVFLMISFITSEQKLWFYKIHKLVTLIIIMQALEYGLYLFNEGGRSSIALVEMLIVIPNYFYFAIFASFMTRFHLFEIFTEQGNLEQIKVVNKEHLKRSQWVQKQQVVQNPKAVQKPAVNAPIPPTRPTPQYHHNYTPPQRPYSRPIERPSTPPKNTPVMMTCPQCKTPNQSPPMCKNCGEALR